MFFLLLPKRQVIAQRLFFKKILTIFSKATPFCGMQAQK